jgi:tryptophanyl-tRNA synthetase
MNWLERMIQFKEKARKASTVPAGEGGGDDSTTITSGVGTGLFTYPVLMAADILLYQATHVPVGEDQRQHLELARDICRRTNDLYAKGGAYKKRMKQAGLGSYPIFTEPVAQIVQTGARVMSLTDGTSKMSKSDPSEYSRINVLDPPDVIRDKIKRCKTDSGKNGIEWDNPARPEATNLLNIYSAVQPVPRSRADILNEVGNMNWGQFKPILAEAIIQHLTPIQERYATIKTDGAYLDTVLRDGAAEANRIASTTLHRTKIALGFCTPPPPPPASSTATTRTVVPSEVVPEKKVLG